MRKDIISITETAVLVALAVVFELIARFIPVFQMPQGGSVSLTMLPIIIIGLRRGVNYGIMGGVAFGIINFMLDGFVIHIGSIFFDYLFAFSVLGLSGLFKKSARKTINLILVIALLGFLRYILHSLSGVLFFSSYAIESGYPGLKGYFIYSFIIYNLPYMGISTLACIIIGTIIKDRVIFNDLNLE